MLVSSTPLSETESSVPLKELVMEVFMFPIIAKDSLETLKKEVNIMLLSTEKEFSEFMLINIWLN